MEEEQRMTKKEEEERMAWKKNHETHYLLGSEVECIMRMDLNNNANNATMKNFTEPNLPKKSKMELSSIWEHLHWNL